MLMIKETAFRFLWILILMTLSGCRDNSFSDLEQYVETTKQTKNAHRQKPPLMVKETHPTTYQAVNLRGPFGEGDVSSKNKTANRDSTDPLQAYPLSMLRFVGIVIEANSTVAYIKTPDNKIFQAYVGDAIGDSDGRITAIYPDRLNITESERAQDGTLVQRVVTLQLKDQH